jgi:hypothetical protein
MNMTASEYRKAYYEQLDSVIEAEERLPVLQAQWAETLRLRNAWHAPIMRTRQEIDSQYDLILDLCELEGGNALIECTAERAEVWRWVCNERRWKENAPYRKLRDNMMRIEAEISRAKCDLECREALWECMPKPKPRRPIKSVLVDGIRTRLETE